ncbi:OmpA family protein, partial [Thiotrichales bacterium HSG1]|nr:OmpA family protein [Thiotrichales bacterium HSG1]
SITKADYSMHGVILYDKYYGTGTMQGNFYHVQSYMVQKKTGEIIAKTDVWISNSNLDYTPLVDNPMVMPGKQSVTEEIVTMQVGTKVPKTYDNSLKVGALISEADLAYESNNYTKALSLYTKASQQSTVRKMMMKTYGGLYKSNIQLGDKLAAEKAFGKLVALSIEEYHTLSVKFLFSVSDTTFDRKLQNEYPIWLSQIGQYFKDNNLCLHIIGHSSRTGKLGYNCNLSLNRAEKIQQLLRKYFPRVKKNSKTDGKAWADNLVGSSTDDAQDAIDRRVEFKVDSCPIFDDRSRHEKLDDCVNSSDEIQPPPSLL